MEMDGIPESMVDPERMEVVQAKAERQPVSKPPEKPVETGGGN
jgi:hypothetical protein